MKPNHLLPLGLVFLTLQFAAGYASTGLGPEARNDVAARMTTAQQPISGCYAETLQRNRKLRGQMNTYKVDVSRLYMSGHSQGSGDTWDYVVNYPRHLAAVVPISGGYGTVSGCALKDTPAWAFNGEADRTVSYLNQVNTVGSINACNAAEPAKITAFPGISHNDIQARVLSLSGLGSGLPQYSLYDQNIYDWLLRHRRP